MTTQCCQIERLYLNKMGAGCFAPIGCWARIESDILYITGYVSNFDGSKYINKTVQGMAVDAEILVLNLVEMMIKNGAKDLLS